MDTVHAPSNRDLPPPTDHPDFPQWLCRAFGAHLKQLRDDSNQTAMGLAKDKGLEFHHATGYKKLHEMVFGK
jgi:hypothetical protein